MSASQPPIAITAAFATYRGTWARVTIDHFRHLASQNCMGHRASTHIISVDTPARRMKATSSPCPHRPRRARRCSPASAARKVSDWPERRKLAHAFLCEYSYKKLKLAQLLGQLGVCLTCGESTGHAAPPPAASTLTTYDRFCVPPSHAAEHAPNSAQLPAQSASPAPGAGAGAG